MLELKNVNKIYKSKNTSNTEALRNINLNFNKVGLTFILGKSGCGKSTLLNILGGLDTPTSGEIIFKGKSFKDFKSSNYDSYRNTSIGFVFQEYNLVEKFNVFDNVAYALKLQNNKIDENVVLNVLEEVGLKDLAKRKVNELSGGQKQRVAIARALVKNPSIILADEPTGNLDSESSKMIFEILKKLSLERLVIVVSHDEESANTYGDRIISLQDGVIVSDTNPQIIDNYTNYEIKKNHLPFKEAFRFSIKNIFGHKLKLIFSILLIAFALSFFGFTIMQYYLRSNSEIERIVNEFDVNYIDINKLSTKYGVCPLDGYYRNCYDTGKFTNDEVETLRSKGNIKLNERYRFQVNGALINLVDLDEEKYTKLGYYYYNYEYPSTFTELKKEQFNFKLIGSVPQKFNEIVIIKPVADYIINYGAYLYNSEDIYKPNSYQELINDKIEIKFGSSSVIISGIIDDDLSEFESLKNIYDSDLRSDKVALVDKRLIEKYRYKYPVYFYTLEGFKEKIELKENDSRYFKFSESSPEDILYTVKLFESGKVYTKDGLVEINKLDNGIIVPVSYLDKISNGDFSKSMNDYIINGKDQDPSKTSDEYREEFITKYINENNITDKMVSFSLFKIYNNDEGNNNAKTLHLRIQGITLDDENYYTTKEILEENSDDKYSIDLYVLTKDIDNYNDFFNDYPIDGEKYISNTDFIYYIAEHEYSMKVASKYIFIISLFFSLFAILLLFNFIGLSITDNKKEIGVLRALGTTKKDVSKIYSIQGLLIGFVSYILSILFVITYAKGENNILIGGSLKKIFNVELFGISFMPLLVMFIFFVVVVLLSSVSVSLRITKMKPIDAINNK
ncbi:MAG: ATP-binding cassette domain-containing protein [Bacilli bacterium]|nr:ATP-binding cassette domain-containing protein [Bacilli bacterium]